MPKSMPRFSDHQGISGFAELLLFSDLVQKMTQQNSIKCFFRCLCWPTCNCFSVEIFQSWSNNFFSPAEFFNQFGWLSVPDDAVDLLAQDSSPPSLSHLKKQKMKIRMGRDFPRPTLLEVRLSLRRITGALHTNHELAQKTNFIGCQNRGWHRLVGSTKSLASLICVGIARWSKVSVEL